jgi:transcriptional regulator GlxA family with amidase domain
MVKNTLRETDLTLEQIAETAGFNSGNYLSQIFKKATGQTPGNYRRNFR